MEFHLLPAALLPEEKQVLLVRICAGYPQETTLARICNDALLSLLQQTGNDRETINERNLFSFFPEASECYREARARHHVTTRDTTFAYPLSDMQAITYDLFEQSYSFLPPEHRALLLFDRAAFLPLVPEYYAFRYPEKKKEALLAIIAQEHHAYERERMALPFLEKIAFIESRLPAMKQQEERHMIAQRLFELQQDMKNVHEKQQVLRLYRKFRFYDKEVRELESWQHEITYLEKKETAHTRGMSTDFIRKHLQETSAHPVHSFWFRFTVAQQLEALRDLEKRYPCQTSS